MRVNPGKRDFILLLALLSCAVAQGQGKQMQLLAPNVGWVLGGGKLYWTTDNGGHWTDITPPVSLPNEKIADVFFKDTTDGWVLLSSLDQPAIEARFELATTINGGARWVTTPVEVPGLNPNQTMLPGGGQVFFLDPRHGWLALGVATGSNWRAAVILATQDGGVRWSRLPCGEGGAFSFTTPDEGWIAGGPGGEYLFATWNGGKSCEEVSLKAPPETGPAVYPLYDAPVFTDTKHGFLPVTYTGPEDSPWALVLFATDDGGRTWSPSRVLAGLAAMGGIRLPSAVADSAWLTARATDSALTLTTTPLRAKESVGSERTSGALRNLSPPVLEMSFVSANQGWVRAGGLFATSDGGATWTGISPWRRSGGTPPTPAGPPSTGGMIEGSSGSAMPLAGATGGGSSVHTSVRTGFDQCAADT